MHTCTDVVKDANVEKISFVRRFIRSYTDDGINRESMFPWTPHRCDSKLMRKCRDSLDTTGRASWVSHSPLGFQTLVDLGLGSNHFFRDPTDSISSGADTVQLLR